MTTIILPTCPVCGCHDIRNEMWVGYRCFKCGCVFSKEETIKCWEAKGETVKGN